MIPPVILALSLVFISVFLTSCSLRMPSEKTDFLAFQNSPFPYEGVVPDLDKPFLDVCTPDGRRGHHSARGGIYWEDVTYSDRRVMMTIPTKFDVRRPAVLVVFLHGNEAILERDVRDRQQLPQQLAQSGLNAILLAPQLAVDAKDSSAGHFWDAGFFARFLDEAAEQAEQLKNDNRMRESLSHAPVILVAYSGGYQAASYALDRGGVDDRIKGVILIDALYGQEEKFSSWIRAHGDQAFFFSSYTEPARDGNDKLKRLLASENIAIQQAVPASLAAGQVSFFEFDPVVQHRDLLTQAWIEFPFADLMRKCNYLTDSNK
jgi:pimeloyl-ACP methyl ester carboxylesterase